MKALRRFRWWFYGGLAVIALTEIAVPYVFHGEVHFDFEHWPAWGSLYGLAACVLIIIVSKLIGHFWLMRQEDYYDR